ncbi:hypothetical protein C8J57DRAFT_1243596 [Mycena rebaudengoi]|nr:hypothetical protein C8J57DRAFT_1243596 [Mycena rebaudengoi]
MDEDNAEGENEEDLRSEDDGDESEPEAHFDDDDEGELGAGNAGPDISLLSTITTKVRMFFVKNERRIGQETANWAKMSWPQASSSLVRKASDADLSPRKNTVPKKKKQLARKSANSETTAPKLAKSRKGGANRV